MRIKKILLKLIAFVLVAGSYPAWADRDDNDHERGGFSFWKKQADVDPLYQKECGSCHLAFPARFMGQSGWQKIMANLDKHFGDNAELDKQDADKILNYLVQNAASDSRSGWGSEVNSLRITDNAYFRREHREVPSRAVGPNSKIKSFSDCQACHQRADKGSFRESEINIPGFGSWDD